MAERPIIARIRRILKKEEQTMQVSRNAVDLVFRGLLALAVMIGRYHSLPSHAEDSPAEAKAPASETFARGRIECAGRCDRGSGGG